VGIDYVSFTTQTKGIETVSNFALGWFPSLEEGGGLLGYKRTLRGEGITICYDGARDQGIHVQISGEGCQAIQSHARWEGWRAFLRACYGIGAIPKRADFAFDEKAGLLSIERMVAALEAEHFTSRYHDWSRRYGRNRKALRANVLYLGSITSPSCICIYDKQVEQIGKGQEDPGKWLRVEMRLKQEQAQAAWDWIEANETLEGAHALLSDAVQFRVPSDDTNKARWEVASWWASFLGDCSKSGLEVKRKVRTLVEGVRAFLKQHAATYRTLELAFDNFVGQGGFAAEVRNVGSVRTNKRHLDRLSQWLNGAGPGNAVIGREGLIEQCRAVSWGASPA
jgi:phage replication initiation protein